MKIVSDTGILYSACQNIQRAVSSKGSIPALECILIDATNEYVILTGYDLDIGSETTINAFVEKKGKIAINAKYLCDILRFLPGSKVTIETDEKCICKISSGDAEYSIVGTPADTYPDLPVVTGENPIVVNQGVLKDMIKKTIYAVAIGDTRPVHTGIKFEIEKGQITLVALDGFRLAIRKEEIDYSGDPCSFIVPAKTLNEIVKVANDDESDYTIIVGKRHIVFEIGGYRIISRLLEGEFLNYKETLPAGFKTRVVVDTKDFIECVERVSLLVSTEKIKTPVRCNIEGNEINLSNITSYGKAKDKCLADIEGNGLLIGFDSRYMLDALRVSDVDRVQISMISGTSPIIVTPVDNEKFLFLILPMRLKRDNEI